MNPHSVPNATLGYPGRPFNGGSNPRFYDFDDGVTRLVKWHPSNHGHKACYNELVASRIGQLFDAPIQRGQIVYVPHEVIPDDHRAIGAVEGFHFASARMVGENFVPAQHYTEIENQSELPYAAVFLAWLAIGDQEGHNQFLQKLEIQQGPGITKATKRFMLIDMGQMFGQSNWADPGVRTVHTTYKLPDHLAQKIAKNKFAAVIAEVGDINEVAIRQCFEDCPDEWAISLQDKEGGIARVLGAKEKIEEILRNGNPALF
jgi:hypothetical protein